VLGLRRFSHGSHAFRRRQESSLIVPSRHFVLGDDDQPSAVQCTAGAQAARGRATQSAA
jgi:hypothetical protein